MNSPKVIAHKQLPARLPFTQTTVAYLVLDRTQAPGWLWGIFGTLFAVIWGVTIYLMCVQEPTELRELQEKPE